MFRIIKTYHYAEIKGYLLYLSCRIGKKYTYSLTCTYLIFVTPWVNLLRKKLQEFESFEDIKLLDMVEVSINKLKGTIVDLAEITKVQKDLGEDAQIILSKTY